MIGARIPGPHMTRRAHVGAARAHLRASRAAGGATGIVVTHGTDALEEAAYLVARSVESDKPVVFTGAMRTSSDLGWDGPGNLAGAVRVAASPDARDVRRRWS